MLVRHLFFIYFSMTVLFAACIFAGDEEVVLDFWFGKLEHSTDFPKKKIELWFGKNLEVDRYITENFEPLVSAASKGELDHWKETPQGRLALIILLDQFPRHIYRDTPKSFAFDEQAINITLEGLRTFDDKKLYPVQRIFFYLPLEHSENFQMQKISLKKYRLLVCDAPENAKEAFQQTEEYAQRHYDIIQKFGRFPHRNEILGRTSTKEEQKFLKDPKSTF